MYGLEFGPNVWAFILMLLIALVGILHESKSRLMGLLWAVVLGVASSIIGLHLGGFTVLFQNFSFS